MLDVDLSCNSYLDRLQQAILNNAIFKSIEFPMIYIKAYKKDTCIIIEVQDNAQGISAEVLDKMFDSYFTTKHKSQGTELGLYMSK